MNRDPLHYVFVDELKGLYATENQLNDLLPQFAKAATSDVLRTTIEAHVQETKKQVERLETIFEQIDEKPRNKRSRTFVGLMKEGEKVLMLKSRGADKDAALIAAAQQVEHFEVTEYGSARTYAQILGFDEAASLLKETLDEEKAAHQRLTDLAKTMDT